METMSMHMSNEKNDEHAKNQLAKTRMRFKVTVVCVGMIMAAVAYAIKMHLGDPHFTAVQTALLTYLAIVIAGFFLDLIIFRSNTETALSRVSSRQRTIQEDDGPD
jgi:hypothetical protein